MIFFDLLFDLCFHSATRFDETPSEDETQEFVSKCKTFSKTKPSKLIAVHCTHGCNRTGFLICAYLVDIMKIDILDAITMFNTARRPGIHKLFVVEELVSRYCPENQDKPKQEGALKDFMESESKRLKSLKLSA